MSNETGETLDEILPAGAVLHYHGMISDWSWGAELAVWELNGEFYLWEGGPAPAEKVSQEYALQEMIDFDAIQSNQNMN